MYFDSSIILLLPAIIVTIIAQCKISQSYRKYSKIYNRRNMTGEQAALDILRANGIYDVEVEMVNGHLTDHYDPIAKKVRLSRDVFFGTSIASIGIAAHEIGHVIQHSTNYVPLILRNKIVPAVNFGASFSWILFLLGLLLSFKPLLVFGIALFSITVIFQLITLPVELNASNRAMKCIVSMNLLYGEEEIKGAKRVLSSAALTYIAAALMSIMSLLRLILLASRRD